MECWIFSFVTIPILKEENMQEYKPVNLRCFCIYITAFAQAPMYMFTHSINHLIKFAHKPCRVCFRPEKGLALPKDIFYCISSSNKRLFLLDSYSVKHAIYTLVLSTYIQHIHKLFPPPLLILIFSLTYSNGLKIVTHYQLMQTMYWHIKKKSKTFTVTFLIIHSFLNCTIHIYSAFVSTHVYTYI